MAYRIFKMILEYAIYFTSEKRPFEILWVQYIPLITLVFK